MLDIIKFKICNDKLLHNLFNISLKLLNIEIPYGNNSDNGNIYNIPINVPKTILLLVLLCNSLILIFINIKINKNNIDQF